MVKPYYYIDDHGLLQRTPVLAYRYRFLITTVGKELAKLWYEHDDERTAGVTNGISRRERCLVSNGPHAPTCSDLACRRPAIDLRWCTLAVPSFIAFTDRGRRAAKFLGNQCKLDRSDRRCQQTHNTPSCLDLIHSLILYGFETRSIQQLKFVFLSLSYFWL